MTPIAIHHIIDAEQRRYFIDCMHCEPSCFWDIHTGFDTFALEAKFPTADGESLQDKMLEIGGPRLVEIIEILIAQGKVEPPRVIELMRDSMQGVVSPGELKRALGRGLNDIKALSGMYNTPETDENAPRNLDAYGTVVYHPMKVADLAEAVFSVEQIDILMDHISGGGMNPPLSVCHVMLSTAKKRLLAAAEPSPEEVKPPAKPKAPAKPKK